MVHQERPAPPHLRPAKAGDPDGGFAQGRTDADLFSNSQTKNIRELQHDIDSLEIKVNAATTSSYEPLLKEQIFARDNTVLLLPDSLQIDKRHFRDMLAQDSIVGLPMRDKERIWDQARTLAKNSRNMFAFDESAAKEALNQLYRSKVEWHKKISLPVSILIFFLIGAPLGAIIRRGGLGLPVVVSVIFFVIYYIISLSGEKLAKEGNWDAVYGMWLSTFILTPIAIYLTYKATNDSALLDTDWYAGKIKALKDRLTRESKKTMNAIKFKRNGKNTILNSVEEVIEDFRNGKPVIVVDDEDRENEGDFIVAAEKITPEIVNFMLKEGRGVLCARCRRNAAPSWASNMMEENNTSLLGTPFTVTVDLLGNGCTTGVSIHDRAATIRALADPDEAHRSGPPGHYQPLRARDKGVLRRPGHTEAAVDLARLAGLQPAGA